MVANILKWLFFAVIALLIVFWVLGGGIGQIIEKGRAFPSFSFKSFFAGTSSIGTFRLPGSANIPQIPTILDPNDPAAGGARIGTKVPSSAGRSNGADSPYYGQVVIAQAAAQAQSTSAQYLAISAMPGISPDIAGWTLQSALTGAVATIPQAASPFILGRVNAVGGITLSSGSIAYVVTGPSPVGVSFSENACTGYLGTLQPFVPALPQKCPAPSTEIPRTAENEARLGSSCFDFMNSLPPCTFPTNLPSGLSNACRSEIQTRFSYQGCVAAHQADTGFSQNSWRIYLAQGRPLWSAQHDVIRLLDGQGRLVSVLNY